MEEGGASWRDVPSEVWTLILSNCGVGSVVRCCLVSKDFCRLASADAVWKAVYLSHFGTPNVAVEGEGWMRRFKETFLSPTWDRELSEEGVWIFSDDNKQVTRFDTRGCYPKAIMSNTLFTLFDRFIVKLHFTMRVTCEFGLFTEPDMQQILKPRDRFSSSYTGSSCSFLSLHSSILYHRSFPKGDTITPLPLHDLHEVLKKDEYSMTLLIEETGSSAIAAGGLPGKEGEAENDKEEKGRRVTFWVNGTHFGRLPLPRRPYAFLYTTGNSRASIRLDRVEFFNELPSS
ncbi:hypothetical protein QOT17_003833 [Balamuthia mandrillaris]